MYKFKRRNSNKLWVCEWQFMHFALKTMYTKRSKVCTLIICKKLKTWKKNLVLCVTKFVMPKVLAWWSGDYVAKFRWKRKLRSFVRIDWVDTLFTLALVKNVPRGQGLNRDYVFIKMAPTLIIMTNFVHKC